MENEALNQFLKKLFISLNQESYKLFEKVTLTSEEFQKNKISKILSYDKFKIIGYKKFESIINKGTLKKINWANLKLQSFILDEKSNDENKILNGHLGIVDGSKSYTIFGVQLFLINGTYKLNTLELSGLFELEILEYYIATDEMYLEQLESEGY